MHNNANDADGHLVGQMNVYVSRMAEHVGVEQIVIQVGRADVTWVVKLLLANADKGTQRRRAPRKHLLGAGPSLAISVSILSGISYIRITDNLGSYPDNIRIIFEYWTLLFLYQYGLFAVFLLFDVLAF